MQENKLPIILLECANSHGGDKTIFEKTIKKFCKNNYKNLHIKFQPFKFDELSTKNYKWYNVYKKLFFKEDYWNKIIKLAQSNYKGVWIDISDSYSLKILKINIKRIYGIKLQSSALSNQIIFENLKKINLKETNIIINVAGYDLKKVKYFYSKFLSLNCKKVTLQLGFQAYPTKISDSNLEKISILKKNIDCKNISYADHLDSGDPYSIFLPITAYFFGAEIIEKHIALKGKNAKYDGFSSINYQQFDQMCENFHNYKVSLKIKSKISNDEKKYLSTSIQKPVLNKDVKFGSLISENDIDYKRSNNKSVSLEKFLKRQSNHYMLKKDLKKDTPLNISNLQKANIATIIACRLKSERLKKKALIKIDKNFSLIDKCIQSCKKIDNNIKVILATSNLKEDMELKKVATLNKVKFVCGDPNDVVKRYLLACRRFKIDVVLRVTGDCPYISKEISNYLLKKHFETGADFTEAKSMPIGAGCQIINVEALKRVISYNKKALLSEYMNIYFTNNQNLFKINSVDLPSWMIRDYRLTVDYHQDIMFFKKIYSFFNKEKKILNLKNLLIFLDKNKKIRDINSNLKLKYKTDKNLIKKLLKETKINAI